MEERRQRLPEAVRPPGKGSVFEPRARMWLTRWRRRWGGKHGAIRTKDELPVQEMRDNAPIANLFCRDFRTPPGSGGGAKIRLNFEAGFRLDFLTPPLPIFDTEIRLDFEAVFRLQNGTLFRFP